MPDIGPEENDALKYSRRGIADRRTVEDEMDKWDDELA